METNTLELNVCKLAGSPNLQDWKQLFPKENARFFCCRRYAATTLNFVSWDLQLGLVKQIIKISNIQDRTFDKFSIRFDKI